MRAALLIFVVASYFYEAASYPNERHPAAAKGNVGIVGGHKISIEEAPYTATLRCVQGGVQYYVCGASIIDERFVLTAASCIQEDCELQVVVGSNERIGNEGELIDVKQINIHPEYDDTTFNYDFCLIELDTPVTFGPKVAKINLHVGDCDLQEGTQFNVIGWGVPEKGCTKSLELQEVVTPLVDWDWCQEYYENERNITQQMICAGKPGYNTCMGDNGDPLTLDGELVGVTSNMERDEECSTYYARVYGKISSVSDWIIENM